jgi:hypothetical protein
MGRLVLAAGIAMLVLAGCSKPTELASEANAKYDRRDPVVAAPAIGEDIDTTPVEPVPGSEEALAPVELEAAPADGTETAPADPGAPISPPTDTLQPSVETAPPVTEPAPAEPAPQPAAPPAETPPAPAPN